jgi:hypothetical protein
MKKRKKRKLLANQTALAELRQWVGAVVAELRNEIERLKADAYCPEPRSTVEEF